MKKCAYASVVASVLLAFAYGCSKAPAPDPLSTGVKSEQASLRAAAPVFELPDLDGKTVKLSDFKGKTVVLEWFNPECPFVTNSHTKGSLVTTAKTWQDKGIVWLAINSAGAGKQGGGLDLNQASKAKLAIPHPILFDAKGTVGKAYGATNTPHMFVIDPEGKLAYRGAIDNSPDGEGESPSNGKLVNYVGQALEELGAGKLVSVPETKAYGCGVKYES